MSEPEDPPAKQGATPAPRSRAKAAGSTAGARPAAKKGSNRGTTVGVILAIAVVLLAVVVVVANGGDDGPEQEGAATTTTAAPTVNARLVAYLQRPIELPDAEYGELCRVLVAESQANPPRDGLEGFAGLMDTYRQLDLDKVIAVAPPSVRPTFTELKQRRDEVLATFQQSERPEDLEPEDFPEQWLKAFATSTRIGFEKCLGEAGLGGPEG